MGASTGAYTVVGVVVVVVVVIVVVTGRTVVVLPSPGTLSVSETVISTVVRVLSSSTLKTDSVVVVVVVVVGLVNGFFGRNGFFELLGLYLTRPLLVGVTRSKLSVAVS